jgi:hypothetical protein
MCFLLGTYFHHHKCNNAAKLRSEAALQIHNIWLHMLFRLLARCIRLFVILVYYSTARHDVKHVSCTI